MLKLLYRTCERFDIQPEHAFLDLEYSSKPPVNSECAEAETSKKDAQKGGKKGAKKGGNAQATLPLNAGKDGAGKLSYKHPRERDESGSWPVPQTGFLSASFSIKEAIARLFSEEALQASPASIGKVTSVASMVHGTDSQVSWLHQDAIVRDDALKPIATDY
jgi:hypothetical protein